MKFIYQYPECNGIDADLLDSGPPADVAVALERTGWDGMAFTEHPVPGARWLAAGGHQTLVPFVALGHVAAVTKRIRLLTYLAVVPYRNPFLLAKAAATVDKLSNGRFILGVGTGYLKSEFFALGVDFDERNALFDEALDVLGLHWKGEPFSYQGLHFTARDVIARPKPVQDPIPIWIGGNAKITLRRVAERAQGWMPLTGPPELSVTARTREMATLDDIAAQITSMREQAGARGPSIDVAMAYMDETITAPKAEVERHRDAIGRMADAGVTHVVLPAPSLEPSATIELVERLAADHIAV